MTDNTSGSERAPTSDRVSAEVVRSEETLRVGTVRVPVERVRLVRHIVTETRQLEVEVRREELRVERTPISDRTAVSAAPAPPAEDLVIVLSEEVPVVTTDVRPRERVRVSIHAVTRDEPVAAEVRRERVAVEPGPRGDHGEPEDTPSR